MKRRPYLISAVAALLLVTVAGAEPPSAGMKRTATIELPGVKGRIDHLATDAEGKRLYVAALGNGTLEIIDLTTNQWLGRIEGLKEPQGVRVLPGSGNVIVASGGDGTVRFFDRDRKPLGMIDGLDDADNVRLDADGKLAYVGYGDGAVAIIDPVKMAKVAEVKLDGHPEAFQLETQGHRLFVNVPTAKQVAVIDREKRSVVATWKIDGASANFPMALDEPNHRLFIGCRSPAEVLVLDTDNGKFVAKVACVGDTDDVFFDTATKSLLVTGGGGEITTVQQGGPDAYHLLANITTAIGARTSLWAPHAKTLYVACPKRGEAQAHVAKFKAE